MFQLESSFLIWPIFLLYCVLLLVLQHRMFEGMLQTVTDLEREEIHMPALEYANSLLLFYLVRWLEGEQFCFLTFMSQCSEEIHTKLDRKFCLARRFVRYSTALQKWRLRTYFSSTDIFKHVNNYKHTEILSYNLLSFLKTLFSYLSPVVKHGDHRTSWWLWK